MKIRQLHINRFGHFSECDLVFPGDGLQVIYGPNEAGKTTLLEFMRGLSFDFPARTPYDFGGQGEMAGVSTVELQDGRIVELRRRKGNKDKVSIKLDGLPTDLDDAGWLKLLDHADRSLFESVFAFGLDQLSRGEESLKHESLQSALFGGSLGGTSSPDKVVAELNRQADELFKKGGARPAINTLLADMKKLSKEIKDHSLRPDRYRLVTESVTTAAHHAGTLHDQVNGLRREHAKIEKRVRAWPKWWELRQRQSELEGLGPPGNVPVDARQRYLALGKELKILADDQAKRQVDIEQTERKLAALQLNPDAVSYRTEITACVELRQSFIEARNDLPERKRKREELQQLIDRATSSSSNLPIGAKLPPRIKFSMWCSNNGCPPIKSGGYCPHRVFASQVRENVLEQDRVVQCAVLLGEILTVIGFSRSRQHRRGELLLFLLVDRPRLAQSLRALLLKTFIEIGLEIVDVDGQVPT